MSLQSTAQIVIEEAPQGNPFSNFVPIEVVEEKPEADASSVQVVEIPDEPLEVEILVQEVPGAEIDPNREATLEVSEEDTDKKEDSDDKNDAQKSKKNPKWDWESKGASGFITWIKERVDDVPRHSGYDSAGLERAVSYLNKLDAEISKAMRMDVDGELDANKIEAVRSQIDDGVARLQERVKKVNKQRKGKTKRSEIEVHEIIKEAQKVTGVKGIYVTVPLLISGLARTLVNGTVSAGHDIEEMESKLSKKFKLDDRERFELQQLLFDMGYPVRKDFGYMSDEDVDTSSSDNFNWAANYAG